MGVCFEQIGVSNWKCTNISVSIRTIFTISGVKWFLMDIFRVVKQSHWSFMNTKTKLRPFDQYCVERFASDHFVKKTYWHLKLGNHFKSLITLNCITRSNFLKRITLTHTCDYTKLRVYKFYILWFPKHVFGFGQF